MAEVPRRVNRSTAQALFGCGYSIVHSEVQMLLLWTCDSAAFRYVAGYEPLGGSTGLLHA